MICLIHYKVIKACYQSVTKSLQNYWNRGTVLFVSVQNKMYPFVQRIEIQRESRPAKSPRTGELTGSSGIKLHS